MNVNHTFDARAMAHTSASSAHSAATTEHERQLADAVGYLAYAMEQLNAKLDAIMSAQTQLLRR